ncbi:type II toxin-antitoxin system HipA family toxin YjjJ [Xylophilus sp. GOD-11R]|uniref:type II toxin-antitoxin system HipA family toxin YjjJ n=1 Tax=Xylophilus sp. GOD-11R TaxID=3089814 RepID=UPI00298C3A43|nr:type II toxin-antitoxin system HipA family toxin YjjJ [Xylophilus sp. GOD-11R]WPB55264.1 type II toxin-antitoxin system HipA family toxin YjjJ [Xylophilus sp. GOD-11R]
MSQPTLSRAMKALGDEVVVIGAARSIQYTLRDTTRTDLHAPIFRVSSNGQLRSLGRLVPVCPDGFVMEQAEGAPVHSDNLPWWLFDMRPQGYLGRAYNQRHGERLGLPARLIDWNDTHVLRALLLQGDDLPGNLLLGDAACTAFANAAAPKAIALVGKPVAYAELAAAAARGEHHGSSAGGEQPKFTAYAQCENGPAHVIVKFSALAEGPVSQRWRDLLQAEHLALDVLRENGIAAAHSTIHDHGAQRFLEVRRFDRDGERGRRALFSVAALDAQFVGSARAWPSVVRALADAGVVQREAVAATETLWAFGTLIGNTDMHGGNLSFISEHGRPYQLAPAYDMSPMAFAPTAGGDLVQRELGLTIGNEVPAAAWHRALSMAQAFVARLQACEGWSDGFRPCLTALEERMDEAATRIGRLAP